MPGQRLVAVFSGEHIKTLQGQDGLQKQIVLITIDGQTVSILGLSLLIKIIADFPAIIGGGTLCDPWLNRRETSPR